MQPQFEKIDTNLGSSFFVRNITGNGKGGMRQWHVHPEYEIVYIEQGGGKRHVGTHISYFEDGDLIFLGPNLPHFAFGNHQTRQNLEVVVQMKPHFLGEAFFALPEMQGIQQLFQRAHQGMVFSDRVKRALGPRLRELASLPPFERLLSLLAILKDMASTTEFHLLEAIKPALLVQDKDYDRISKVYQYVETHFQEHIALETVAGLCTMTVPAFCRFFKRLTQKTFSEFLNTYRIMHACQLLSQQNSSIMQVGFECGFNTTSYFNKQFKKHMGRTPSDYQKQFVQVVGKGAEVSSR